MIFTPPIFEKIKAAKLSAARSCNPRERVLILSGFMPVIDMTNFMKYLIKDICQWKCALYAIT